MDIGDCFFNKSGRNTPSHLWIVLSDPALDAENVLIVNITDAGNHHDASCVVSETDHAAITKESVVAYQFAKITSNARLTEANAAGLLIRKEPISDELLTRILEGAYASDELTGRQRELLRSQRLID